MYTVRYLGAEGFGILSLAFTGIFGVFSDLGLSTLTVREVARDKSSQSKTLFKHQANWYQGDKNVREGTHRRKDKIAARREP